MDRYCKKCGLLLGFKQLPTGKWCPTNPDGTDHWDLCRETWLKNMSAAERKRITDRDREWGKPFLIVGKNYRKMPDDGTVPWDE